MSTFIQKVLEIEEEEEAPVLLLLANSFFIGIFIVTYDVASNTLFLDTFGKEYLTRVPIMSGILGILSTYIFTYFQRRVLFTNLALISFTLITCIVAFLYIGIAVYDNTLLKFLSYLLLFPINTIFILCFYGTVSRSFSLKREKHMTGTVDQGQMLSTALGFFALLALESYFPNAEDYFIGSIISGGLATFFMAIFVVRFADIEALRERMRLQSGVAKFSEMAENPYIRMLAALFLVSVIATQFLEFSFLSVTVEKFETEKDIANFIAFFGGLVTVFSLILQTFVADRVIKMYGMRLSLSLIPLLLGLFTVLAALVGTFFGYSAEEGSFIVFFLFMAMSKLFMQSLKESFEDPIFKILFIPLDSKTRFDIQAKIEGITKEFSNFIAGILLTVLSFLAFFSLIFYTYFLIIVCLIYLYVIIRLFVEYRRNLTNTLVNTKISDESESKKDYEVTDVFLKELKNKNTSTVIYTLKLLEKIEPILAEIKFNEFLTHPNEKIREYALLRLESNESVKSIERIKEIVQKETNQNIKTLAESALKHLSETDSVQVTPAFIYSHVKSRNIQDRLLACKYISKEKDEALTAPLLLLLRDADPKVRFSAIVACASQRRPETWPLLIEYLSSYTFCNVAAAALIAHGEYILPTLESAFYKTGQSATIQEKIVQIYGRIQGPTVIELLWNKIDFPDKKIVNNVLLCLSSCGFRPEGERAVRIKQAIESDIGNSAWNIAALTEIPTQEYVLPLKQALEEEIEFNFENIYMLLALIYDAQSIKLVKDNIESGTVEGIVYAIELLDVFLADELKPILFPLLEDISQVERNERLQGHFPRQPLTAKEVLLQIINRDYNSINKWTKACAIYAYAKTPEYEVCDDLVANLFNPDALLREVSAWSIFIKDQALYHKHTKRLTEHHKNELDAKFILTDDAFELGFKPTGRLDKIFFLKQMEGFKNVHGAVLVEFVELIEEVHYKAGETILARGISGNTPLFIIVSGKAVMWEKEGDVLMTLQEKDMVGDLLVLDTDLNNFEVKAQEDTILFRINKDKFFEQITDNFEIAKEIIKVVDKKIKKISAFEQEVMEIEK